ncbi:hypothetical protein DFS34DRAFT_630177 [Phlyctochytrium arcticum]|nr:hypothetical protein DFS34DRAFT_630177 [Phlyctochytrium arcticum]
MSNAPMGSPPENKSGSGKMDSLDSAYDPNMEWVHCGRCRAYEHSLQSPFAANGKENAQRIGTKFFVTSCAHIACEPCFRALNSQGEDSERGVRCPVCEETCSVIELSDKIPEEIERIFVPAIVHLEDAVKIWKLQYGNAVKLLRFLKMQSQESHRKYLEAVSSVTKAQKEIKELREQLSLRNGSSSSEPSTRFNQPNKNRDSSSDRGASHSDNRPRSSRSQKSANSPANMNGNRSPYPVTPTRLSIPPRQRAVTSNQNSHPLLQRNGPPPNQQWHQPNAAVPPQLSDSQKAYYRSRPPTPVQSYQNRFPQLSADTMDLEPQSAQQMDRLYRERIPTATGTRQPFNPSMAENYRNPFQPPSAHQSHPNVGLRPSTAMREPFSSSSRMRQPYYASSDMPPPGTPLQPPRTANQFSGRSMYETRQPYGY